MKVRASVKPICEKCKVNNLESFIKIVSGEDQDRQRIKFLFI